MRKVGRARIVAWRKRNYSIRWWQFWNAAELTDDDRKSLIRKWRPSLFIGNNSESNRSQRTTSTNRHRWYLTTENPSDNKGARKNIEGAGLLISTASEPIGQNFYLRFSIHSWEETSDRFQRRRRSMGLVLTLVVNLRVGNGIQIKVKARFWISVLSNLTTSQWKGWCVWLWDVKAILTCSWMSNPVPCFFGKSWAFGLSQTNTCLLRPIQLIPITHAHEFNYFIPLFNLLINHLIEF